MPGFGKLAALKISIVIPAFNEELLLGETLQRVKAALAPVPWETELIVCDNNSTDTTARIAAEAGAKVVFESVNQIARARNRGAEAASGEWLIFIDADSWPSAELIAEVASEIQSGRWIAGGCTLRLEGRHPVASVITWLWNHLSRQRRLLAGSFIFCETVTFRQVGGFSEELFAGEELELSRRLQRLGRETGRGICILHRHPLLTSARKVRLYTPWEHIRFLVRVALNYRGVVSDRHACHQWYDGRR